MRARTAALTLAVAAAVAACGATPPQAPQPVAMTLSDALSSVSLACGRSLQVHTYGQGRGQLASMRKNAEKGLSTLAKLAKQHPEWIYQDKTIAELHSLAKGEIKACGL
jgi:hypothetical protein